MGGSSNSGLSASQIGSDSYMASTQALKDQQQRQQAQNRLKAQTPGGGYLAQSSPYLSGIYGSANQQGGMQNPYKKQLQQMKDQYTGARTGGEDQGFDTGAGTSGFGTNEEEDFNGGDFGSGGGW